MKLNEQLLKEYYNAYVNFKNNKDKKKREVLKKIVNNLTKLLRKEIALCFKSNGEKRVVFYKQKGILKNDDKIKTFVESKKDKVGGILFGKEILDILRFENKNEKGCQIVSKYIKDKIINESIEKNIFDTFHGSTYFKNFQQSRQNFYKDDGTSTAIPTRIIDDNFPKFLDNKIIFEKNTLENMINYLPIKKKKFSL
ncbi:MAG: hypothetical protein CO138_00735 [Candidatus Moranbacteria bacterium CG_4_9_14_3_um_filter_33_15]|nr:MAG: hypothetical protein COT31_00360 [Candidatus Moranbacteria bacterium CG08_land_8_20_14_0_20_34_16]PJA89388.1 MAG: hypothetical protein CO138_00735 [Candidatus Moranbacteria bacterium CG_4_9_14_3_um_filter_33_15]